MLLNIFIKKILFIFITLLSGLSISYAEIQKKYTISQYSYENRRTDFQHFSRIDLPLKELGFDARNGRFRIQDARAIFKYPDGSIGFVQHTLVNGPWNTPKIKDAIPGKILLFKKINGIWKNNDSIIDKSNNVPGCIHPRKIIAADFNKDGIIDFVIACQGWDAKPYPGERSRILLSQPEGTYKFQYMSDHIDFQHGATSGDINGDGYPDLIVTALKGAHVFINNHKGFFIKSNTYKLPQIKKAFHVELIDINNDGLVDLIVGSHSWQDSAKIILNPGDNNFGKSSKQIIIPEIPGAGTIVDFLYIKPTNTLYILRTGDGKYNGTKFYHGMWLQKFNLTNKKSNVVYENKNYKNETRRAWHTWIIEKNGFIMSDYDDSIVVPINQSKP